MMKTLVAFAVLASSAIASAQSDLSSDFGYGGGYVDEFERGQGQEQEQSDRWGSLEFSIGSYRPNIDSEFSSAHPYKDIFGSGRGLMFRGDVAKSLFTEFGELDIGVGVGYFQVTGHGFEADSSGTAPSSTVSVDETTFRIVPTRLSLTYRFDVLAERFGIPFAPYARISFDRYFWWVTNAVGNVSRSLDGNDTAGRGATNGWSFSGGLAFQLDWLDSDLSREFQRDIGVQRSYLFVDITKSSINNFGSSSSWDLSNDGVSFSGGLLFNF